MIGERRSGWPPATAARSCRSPVSRRTPTSKCIPGAVEETLVNQPNETKIDVRERGAQGQITDRRLYMQLQVLTGCGDVKPLVGALETSRLEGVLYQDVNDPRGVGVLAMSENPTFFVT